MASVRENHEVIVLWSAAKIELKDGFRLVGEYRNGEILLFGEDTPSWMKELYDQLNR